MIHFFRYPHSLLMAVGGAAFCASRFGFLVFFFDPPFCGTDAAARSCFGCLNLQFLFRHRGSNLQVAGVILARSSFVEGVDETAVVWLDGPFVRCDRFDRLLRLLLLVSLSLTTLGGAIFTDSFSSSRVVFFLFGVFFPLLSFRDDVAFSGGPDATPTGAPPFFLGFGFFREFPSPSTFGTGSAPPVDPGLFFFLCLFLLRPPPPTCLPLAVGLSCTKDAMVVVKGICEQSSGSQAQLGADYQSRMCVGSIYRPRTPSCTLLMRTRQTISNTTRRSGAFKCWTT